MRLMPERYLARCARYLTVILVACSGMVGTCCEKTNHFSQSQQRYLSEYGALLVDGRIFLSEELVPNCQLRQELDTYLSDALIGGTVPEKSTLIAERNSETIGRILRRIWPAIANSPAMPSDGDFRYEKWRILEEKTISDEDVAAIVKEEIEKNGVGDSAAYLLLNRPLPGLTSTLMKVLEVRSDNDEKLFTIAILASTTNVNCVPMLDSLERPGNLSPTQQAVMGTLRDRIRIGRKPVWSDVRVLAED